MRRRSKGKSGESITSQFVQRTAATEMKDIAARLDRIERLLEQRSRES